MKDTGLAVLVLVVVLVGALVAVSVHPSTSSGVPLPATPPLFHYYYSSAWQTTPMLATFTVNHDAGSLVYADAAAWLSGSSSVQYSAAPLTYGSVGYWVFDQNATGACTGSVYDQSHQNNTGTCTNSPTFVSAPAQYGGGALSFTAAGSTYVNIPSSSSISPTGDYSLTIWFDPTSNTAGFFVLKNGEYGMKWNGATSAIEYYDDKYISSTKTSWSLN